MKSKQQALFLMILFFALCSICVNASTIRVFRLSYADPASTANVITSLFGNKVNVATAGSLNAVVVNAQDADLLQEIEKLVKVLDRRPATLRFSIQSEGNTDNSKSSLGANDGKPVLNFSSTKNRRSTGRTVVATEFAKAAFTDETVRIYNVQTLYGQAPMVVSSSRGLRISGRLAQDGNVLVQVWYSEGGDPDYSQLLTEVTAIPGQWFSIGGSIESLNSKATSAGIKEVAGKKTGNQTDRRFRLKVDVIR